MKKPSSNRLSRLGRSKKIEEPGIELFVEAILEAAEEADEVVAEETFVESIVEAVHDKAAERVEELLVEPSVEAVRDKAARESRLYVI